MCMEVAFLFSLMPECMLANGGLPFFNLVRPVEFPRGIHEGAHGQMLSVEFCR